MICSCCGWHQLLTQICVALSALVLRAVEWRKPVEQLFASLNELQGQGTGSNAVLELLTVLPEEVIEDQTVSVDSGMRWQFSQEVSHYASQAERDFGNNSFFSYPYRRIGHLSVYLLSYLLCFLNCGSFCRTQAQCWNFYCSSVMISAFRTHHCMRGSAKFSAVY
jgi:hypothetical protein